MDLFDLYAKITIDTGEYESGIQSAVSNAGQLVNGFKALVTSGDGVSASFVEVGDSAGSAADGLGETDGSAGNLFDTFASLAEGAAGLAAHIGPTLASAADTAVSAFSSIASGISNVAGWLADGISSTAEYGDNIDKMSQKMGLSAEAYQEWDAIMQHSGTSIESLQAGMKTLANAVESGNDAFDRLGITQEQIAGMNNEELFSATITALQNVENETERTYLAGQLLGRGATELGALLNTSAEDTEAMRQRVHELGGVMSDEAVKSAAAYQDSLQDMQTAFSGLSRGLMSDFLPSITTVMDGLTGIFAGDSGAMDQVTQGIMGFLDTVAAGVPQFLETGVLIIESLVSGISDSLPEIMDGAVETISTLIDSITDMLPDIIETGVVLLGKLAVGIIQAIPDLVSKVPQIIWAIANGIAQSLPYIVEAGAEIVDSIGEGFLSMVDSAMQWGGDLVQSFIDGIKAKISALKNVVSNVAQTVKNFIGFSEPKEGPLSNFHTYAPDMMRLFADGIKDNSGLIKSAFNDSLDFGTASVGFASSGIGRSTSIARSAVSASESGPITIIVQSVLDGNVIGETSYQYARNKERAYGLA